MTMPEALNLAALEMAIGGSYEMPDGRAFWLDHPVVLEIIRRATPVILAALQRVQAETWEADAKMAMHAICTACVHERCGAARKIAAALRAQSDLTA